MSFSGPVGQWLIASRPVPLALWLFSSAFRGVQKVAVGVIEDRVGF